MVNFIFTFRAFLYLYICILLIFYVDNIAVGMVCSNVFVVLLNFYVAI